MQRLSLAGRSGVLMMVLGLVACGDYVRRDEFDSTVAGLRATDSDLQGQVSDMRELFSELTGQLNRKFDDYDAQIASVQGRLRIEMTAHFEYDDDTLREADKPALDEFTEVIRAHHSNVIVTVEGFTDPAGNAEYNKRLGLRRAQAVRDYLINIGGLNPDKVRAVSYGEDPNRQVKANAWGADGAANRRVALVIDYVAPDA